MKKVVLVSIFLILGFGALAQQKIIGRSKMKEVQAGKSVVTPKIMGAPDLIIKEELFIDPNNNNVIDADERSVIRFNIENLGNGDAKKVKVRVSLKNQSLIGLDFPANYTIGDLKPAKIQSVEIPLSANMNLEDGIAEFKIEVLEQSGFDAYPLEMKIETHPFVQPLVVVADAVFSTEKGGISRLNAQIQLKCLIQNIGKGQANSVKVECLLPTENCFPLGEQSFDLADLKPGESREIDFPFITNRNYTGQSIPVRILLSERHQKFSRDTIVIVQLNQTLVAQNKVVISAIPTAEPLITKASLSSFVDRNIPVTGGTNPKKYALIIGNEDYSKYQNGLNTEVDVAFARNDARILKEYAISTLGFEESNVFLRLDATSGEMNQKLDLISKLAAKTGNDAEILFYYAGHGLPDEATQSPYLMPVDVSSANLNQAIKLGEILKKLGETNAARITIILDACFSGGGRTSGLLAARSAKIKPNNEQIFGNTVVFSATTGIQSALSYQKEGHGIFTYFFLKKLQETSGKISYKQMANYLSTTVSLESLKINQKDQDPEVLPGSQVQNQWESWSFR
jgi:hypothetical protein